MEVREGCGLQLQLQISGAHSFTPTESSQIAYRGWDSTGLEKRESLPGAPGLAGFETRAKHQYGKRSVAETSVSAHPTRSPGPVPSPGRRTGESCSTAIAPALPPDHAIPSSSGPRVSVVQMKIPTQGQKRALNGAPAMPSSQALKKLAGRYDSRIGPCAGKVVHIPSYYVMRTGGFSAFKENIVVRVGAGTHPFRRLHPEALFPNSAKRAVNLAATSTEFWAAKHFFILRENLAAYAKLNIRFKNSEQENLCWCALRVQQCRKKDIGVEDNPKHCSAG